MKISTLRAKYVQHLPESLEEGVLYISEEFSIAGHRCCCGCGEEVITPLNPAQWRVRSESGGISLYPSIGNWKFACRSHYWIRRNKVVEALTMSEREIELVKQRDHRDKGLHIHRLDQISRGANQAIKLPSQQGLISAVLERLGRWWRALGER